MHGFRRGFYGEDAFLAIFVFMKLNLYICISMISKEDKVKMLANEIGDITDPAIKDFATKMVEEADDYFFVVPASSSGKYHPQFDLGDGGLVRHTRCVVYYAECISESFNFTSRQRDMIIVSALAHDIKKQGDGRLKRTVTEHPILGAEYVMQIAKEVPNAFSAEELSIMTQAIRSHMGKWGGKDGLPVPETEFDKCLQAADYIASRKDILQFNFRPTEDVEIEVPKEDPGDFIIDFGKYKGKGMTIRQIHEAELKDPSKKGSTYIQWMAGLQDFAMRDAQEAGRKFLAEYKEPVQEVVHQESIDDLPF